jgi:O-antigen/teichoic acid export membrane protein
VKKYGEYPRYNMITSFMSACSFLLPMIFINKFFSTENAGYFDLSKLLLSLPFALIATSISNVLLQRISEKFRNTISFKKELSSMFFVVLTIAIIEVIVISLFGVDLFRIIFGMKWIISGEISTILVWSYAFNFITSSFSSIFISMKKIKLLSVWQIIYFISIISLILFRNLGFMKFLKVYVIIELTCYLLNFVLMFLIVVNYENRILIK